MILIIANARRTGGLSGSDNIYENFAKHWPGRIDIWDMVNIDFKPFWLCYLYRIVRACIWAMRDKTRYTMIYSASDFLMDSLPGLIYKMKGIKWVAGFYLYAPPSNIIYWLTQKIAYRLIKWKADIVCITNSSMKWGFKNKKTIEVNGGVDLSLAGHDGRPRIYDAVWCNRIHPTKGVKELVEIWKKVREKKPDATLALIGDGDMGTHCLTEMAGQDVSELGITVFGYMGSERFDIYKSSKMVLYTATTDHFSMAPVEAMACGCPMLAFNLPVMKHIKPRGAILAEDIEAFILSVYDIPSYSYLSKIAMEWARTWDWKERAKTVYKQIIKEIST